MSLGQRIVSRRGTFGLVGALAVLTAVACASEPAPPADSSAPTSPPDQGDPDGATMQTAAGDPGAAAYQAGATGFALSMLAAAAGSAGGNAVISPLSISQCIALVGQGADGATVQQIAQAFGCADAQELRAGANAEITAIAALSQATFDMANTAFTDESFEVKGDYVKTVADWFGVAAHTTDFSEPEKATATINAWVADRTNDKIPELLDPDQVTPDTRTVLVNALYLNALWSVQFDPERSTDLPFTLADGAEIQTRFMRDEREVQLAQQDGAMLLELPYQDADLAALFYLPAEGTGLADAISDLQASSLLALVAGMETTAANLYLPVFEARQRLEVTQALQSRGILDAFDPAKADFTALADEPTFISFVQHEAWLKVAEKGTEGAAATAGGAAVTGALPGHGAIDVRLDRPFLFAVRIRSTGSVAFIAAVQDPSAK